MLAAIDLYNDARGWVTYRDLPLEFKVGGGSSAVVIGTETRGKDFVAQLGEPRRKGGGEVGTGGLGPGLWMEWQLTLITSNTPIPFTLLVELSRTKAPSAAKWDLDQAGSSPWHTLTISTQPPSH